MYNLRVIPPDLRHEETLIEAAKALDKLNKTINLVFQRIDDRITSNNVKVQVLKSRIEKSQKKIESLVGSKKAIRIFSPARFPAAGVLLDISKTHNTRMEFQLNENTAQARPDETEYEITSRVELPLAQSLQEKLIFFHVRDGKSTANPLAAAKKYADEVQGLGEIPKEVNSVNSLLLFNTKDQVYGLDDTTSSEYNAWKRTKLCKDQRLYTPKLNDLNNPKKIALDAPPPSLYQKSVLVTAPGNLRYAPKLEEAPEINLPMDLPDLPGVADDIHFVGQQQQIAPSLYIDNLPDLSDLVLMQKQDVDEQNNNDKVAETNNEKKSITSSSTTLNTTSSGENKTSPPPPPPPPPPPVVNTPTPPPPPPPALNTPKSDHKPPTDFETRSQLMDAIREAGGARGGRLRTANGTASATKVENAIAAASNLENKSTTGKSISSVTISGDLMADLHNKLQMRRKVISGSVQNETGATSGDTTTSSAFTKARTNTDPVISRLSALIPAPPTLRENKTIDEDDDWTD